MVKKLQKPSKKMGGYYPFGLKHKGYNNQINGNDHPYGFGGKEENDELSLVWHDFGARNYDATIGRWMNLDPLAEEMRRHSPYNYAFNNPLVFTDPDGMAPFTDLFDKNGNKIGDDGVNNGVNVMIKNKNLAKQIKKEYKAEGKVDLLDNQFSFNGDDIQLLPTDTALKESLNVLDRTSENGGLSEESSIVMNDKQIIRGKTSDPINFGTDSQVDTTTPALPMGMSKKNAEVSIHSHPIEAKMVGNKVYSSSALELTQNDKSTFRNYKMNITVGRLGKATATNGIDQQTGRNSTTIQKPNLGIVIHPKGRPSISLTVNKVKNMINN